ncbi:MAG TPA: hypothetical protein VH590_01345, partial [Ktedonobacterales bacterium]
RGEAHSHPERLYTPVSPAALLPLEDADEETRGSLGISGLDASDAPEDHDAPSLPAAMIDALLEIRGELRREKRWALADKLRDALKEAGIVIEDTPAGPRWLYQPDGA